MMRIILTLVFSFFLTAQAWGAVAFEAAMSQGGGGITGLTDVFATSGSNRFLLCSSAAIAQSTTSITYNGVSMSALTAESDQGSGSFFFATFKLVAPASGSNTWTTTLAGSSDSTAAGCMSLTVSINPFPSVRSRKQPTMTAHLYRSQSRLTA
jgi:hypothetical protein